MFPEKDIATAISAPFWHLATIGAAHSGWEPLDTRFSEQWEQYVASMLEEFLRAKQVLEADFGFDPRMSELLLEDWKLRGQLKGPETELDVEIAIGVTAFAKRTPSSELGGRARFLELAARRQLAMLLEIALLLEWIATEEGHKVPPTTVATLLAIGAKIGAGAAAFSPSDVVGEAAREWMREEPWTVRGYGADFQALVRRRVAALARQLSEATDI